MFARRVNYSDIWFCNEYFIADVNILAETPNRKFVKEIDLILSTYGKTFQYRNIKGAWMAICVFTKCTSTQC